MEIIEDEIINDYVYLRVKRLDLFALNKSVAVEPSETDVGVSVKWDVDDEAFYLSHLYVNFKDNCHVDDIDIPKPVRFEFVGESKKSKLDNVRLGDEQVDPWKIVEDFCTFAVDSDKVDWEWDIDGDIKVYGMSANFTAAYSDAKDAYEEAQADILANRDL